MNISGIHQSFQSERVNANSDTQINNNYNVSDDNSKSLPLSMEKQNENESNGDNPNRENQKFDSYGYASLYPYDNTVPPSGGESDISNLDVEKAISDMEKDRILQQYQFFIS